MSENISKGFILQPKCWIGINQYVEDGVVLPTNSSEMRSYLNVSNTATLPEIFEHIYPVYTSIKNHTINYKDGTFPSMMQCLSDLSDYATKAPCIYEECAEHFNFVRRNSKELFVLKKRMQELYNQANEYSDNVDATYYLLSKFITNLEQDQLSINNLKTILSNYLQDNELQKLTDRLNQTLSNAKTQSDAVSECRQQIDTFKQQFQMHPADIRRELDYIDLIKKAQNQIEDLSSTLEDVLPELSIIKGTWETISIGLEKMAKKEQVILLTNQIVFLRNKLLVDASLWKDIADKIAFNEMQVGDNTNLVPVTEVITDN
ncbi:HBL/NHE enterotoxin family protein [Thermoactinomyces sp. DSM 45891]|uniref:HBL/NHE enterotoxin family protein n=1 Tax=Thermoactinomyces sp. DSM 45891 TaxID=1761907 RepID=UPI000931D301|nr:HBL/NHE enterotoxin family protein [Thermoactinomyces sp. DSM 45891]